MSLCTYKCSNYSNPQVLLHDRCKCRFACNSWLLRGKKRVFFPHKNNGNYIFYQKNLIEIASFFLFKWLKNRNTVDSREYPKTYTQHYWWWAPDTLLRATVSWFNITSTQICREGQREQIWETVLNPWKISTKLTAWYWQQQSYAARLTTTFVRSKLFVDIFFHHQVIIFPLTVKVWKFLFPITATIHHSIF